MYVWAYQWLKINGFLDACRTTADHEISVYDAVAYWQDISRRQAASVVKNDTKIMAQTSHCKPFRGPVMTYRRLVELLRTLYSDKEFQPFPPFAKHNIYEAAEYVTWRDDTLWLIPHNQWIDDAVPCSTKEVPDEFLAFVQESTPALVPCLLSTVKYERTDRLGLNFFRIYFDIAHTGVVVVEHSMALQALCPAKMIACAMKNKTQFIHLPH